MKKELKEVHFPGSIRFIGNNAFSGCGLKELVLPDWLEVLGRAAFRGNNMKSVIIPASVRKVEEWVFMDCEYLKKIHVESAKTLFVWPAITGRKDGKEILIITPENSNAQNYCMQYSEKYHLVFQKRNK